MVARRVPAAPPPVSMVLTESSSWRELVHDDEVTVVLAHRLAAAARWSTPSAPVSYFPDGRGWQFIDTGTGEVLDLLDLLEVVDAWLIAAGPALRAWCWSLATTHPTGRNHR